MKLLAVCVLVMKFVFGNTGAQQTESDHLSHLSASHVYSYEQMSIKIAENGSESRSVVGGSLATGEAVGIHESMQPAAAVPNPPHKIEHSEFIVVQQGTLEFQHDGKAERAGIGDVIYVAFDTLHTLRNVGDVPAKYVVIQVGGDTKK